MFNYFERQYENKLYLDLNVIFERKKNKELNLTSILNSINKTPLKQLTINSEGNIENSVSSIQIDFANSYIGGGVLSTGILQEEIRFITSPECLISILLFEKLEKNEVAIIYGTE